MDHGATEACWQKVSSGHGALCGEALPHLLASSTILPAVLCSTADSVSTCR